MDYAWLKGRISGHRCSHRVTLVWWTDAEASCRWLGGVIDQSVRLQTKAKRKHAARVGVTGLDSTVAYIDSERTDYLDHPSVTQVCAMTVVGL